VLTSLAHLGIRSPAISVPLPVVAMRAARGLPSGVSCARVLCSKHYRETSDAPRFRRLQSAAPLVSHSNPPDCSKPSVGLPFLEEGRHVDVSTIPAVAVNLFTVDGG
jgi:hypothetical protein